eukprot:156006_1
MLLTDVRTPTVICSILLITVYIFKMLMLSITNDHVLSIKLQLQLNEFGYEFNLNQTDIQSKIFSLTNGTISYLSNTSSNPYWTPSDIKLRSFKYTEFRQCFKNKWIIFIGDSRIRFSFAEWLTVGNNFRLLNDTAYPHNDFSRNVEWIKGRGCKMGKCIRNWTQPVDNISLTLYATKGRIYTYLGNAFNSKKPDLLFFNKGAWTIQPRIMKNKSIRFDVVTDDIQHQMSIINGIVPNSTLKIWMSYPECGYGYSMYSNILNNRIRNVITTNEEMIANNWIYFNLPTAPLPNKRFCEGFHVIRQWTNVEISVIVNALCSMQYG